MGVIVIIGDKNRYKNNRDPTCWLGPLIINHINIALIIESASQDKKTVKRKICDLKYNTANDTNGCPLARLPGAN